MRVKHTRCTITEKLLKTWTHDPSSLDSTRQTWQYHHLLAWYVSANISVLLSTWPVSRLLAGFRSKSVFEVNVSFSLATIHFMHCTYETFYNLLMWWFWGLGCNNARLWTFSIMQVFAKKALLLLHPNLLLVNTVKLHESTASPWAWFAWIWNNILPLKVCFSLHHLLP